MNEGEIEREIRNDTVWRRPTWPMGGGKKGAWYRYGRGDIGDDFGAFRGAADESSTSQGWRPVHNSPEDKAYRILGLEPSVSLTDLKARYKELVKLHHPDTHGGDKQAEERLKDINDAYATLRKCVTA